MVKTAEALLQQELGAARAGTHQRQKSEEKRLSLLKIQKLKKAEQTHQNRVAAVDARFEEQKREVEEDYTRERVLIQDRLTQELKDRQKKSSKSQEDMNALRAMTRRYQQTRGADPALATKAGSKRDLVVKGSAQAVPLRQGEVEEDFELMMEQATAINPSVDIGFMEIDFRARDRQRPVDSVMTKRPLDGAGGKRQRRGDFDMKGKPRAEVSGARITVWYEEEHGGRKMDVPYMGVVNSCDPREGLYVKFDNFAEEMLITNEDDWRWGSHSRKPPETSGRR
ncbi:hypothetical protein Ctob_008346 [Chrysochromulina tobinii]|uniref:Uncharacterized protein n=1 Tax=Chrysochromulina tobinii TaxID=1460289 RepID=A0A0M0JP58_9EUKA|nr:hypothetical protein Ctob_008346 [Chrysochromulina tobinii]|eukprot:KOO28280.1 hypothetical protein Ctob_008346 [Chrysochromulina sp. CCMP291]